MPATIVSGVSAEDGQPHVIATDSHGRIIIADSERDEPGQSDCPDLNVQVFLTIQGAGDTGAIETLKTVKTVEVVKNVETVTTVETIAGLVGTRLGATILNTDVLRAAIYASNRGDNVLIPAIAGQCIRVLSLVLTASGTTAVQLESGPGGPVLMRVNLVKNNNFVLPVTLPGYHWIETLEGDSLNLRLSKKKMVSGCIVYCVD